MEELTKLNNEAKEILRLLFLTELNDEEASKINGFVDNYLVVLDNHTNNKGGQNNLEKLQIYENVINPVFGEFDDFDPNNYPAIGIIKEKVNNYYHSIDNSLAKTLTLNKTTNNHGVATTILIVGATVIAGIGLGALLWFIK